MKFLCICSKYEILTCHLLSFVCIIAIFCELLQPFILFSFIVAIYLGGGISAALIRGVELGVN